MKKLFFLLLFPLAASCQIEMSGVTLSGVNILQPSTDSVPSNTIVVLIEFPSQSNNGKEDVRRLVIKTTPLRPSKGYAFYKPNYTTTDDGTLMNAQSGYNTNTEGMTGNLMWGAKDALIGYFTDITGNPTFLINAGVGGVGIGADAGGDDFSPSSTGEAYDKGVTGKILPGLADIHALYPTASYAYHYVILFHGMETDAQSATKTTNALTNIQDFFTNLYADVTTLTIDNTVIMMFSGHYWAQFADLTYPNTSTEATREVTINTAKQSYCSSVSNAYYIDYWSDTPRDRMYELTTEEKAGVVSGGDDAHTSYRGHLSKADKVLTTFFTHFNYLTVDRSEITDNTTYDFNSLVTNNALRLQLNRSNMTITGSGGTPGDENTVTDVADEYAADWTVSGSARLKVQERHGEFWIPPGATTGSTRIVSPTSLPNSIFSNGVWTIGGWAKFSPNTSGGNPEEALFFTTNTFSGSRSRVLVYKDANGELRVDTNFASATTKSALTTTGFFRDVVNEGDSEFIHWSVTCDGTNLKIFKNGVQQSLDATSNGVLSGGGASSSFNNSTNGIVVGQRQTGASTFDFGMMGEIREVFAISHVALTGSQIIDLMQN